MSIHVALLRGINVGGKNRLAMADLVSAFERAGATKIRTYLQSGNVVFDAPATVARGVEARLGLDVPVVLRTAREMERIAGADPFPGVDPGTLHVAFLADSPSRPALASLDPRRSPPDEISVVGREVYLRLPNGVARTKFTNAYLDRVLQTTSTLRNWRTVSALAALVAA